MCQHKGMEPKRPEEQKEQETARIVRERLATFDEDQKTVRPARQALADIRHNLKHPAPR